MATRSTQIFRFGESTASRIFFDAVNVMAQIGLVRLQLLQHHRDAFTFRVLSDLCDRANTDIHGFFNRQVPQAGTGVDEKPVRAKGQCIVHRAAEEIDRSLYRLFIRVSDAVRIGERFRRIDDKSHSFVFRLLSKLLQISRIFRIGIVEAVIMRDAAPEVNVSKSDLFK